MSKRLLILALASASILPSCTEEPRNTEPLTDPWLRERTPVNIRLESQIGAAVISDDWTDDTVGSVTVSLITTGLDLSKVKVEAVDFKYPDSEFCPKASIGPGSTLDLSSGKTSFTVTAYNGETRTYSLEYSKFRDPLEGTYSFTKVAGILDEKNAPKCSFIVHWDTGYMPTDEDDNILSFRLEKADAETGETYGTLDNKAGPDGLYANYMYDGTKDMNEQYRIFPKGKSRWHKPDENTVVVHSFEDTEYTTPLYTVYIVGAGEQTVAGVSYMIPSGAFARAFPGPFNTIDWNYPDTRWYTDNLRFTVWLVQKDSDNPTE